MPNSELNFKFGTENLICKGCTNHYISEKETNKKMTINMYTHVQAFWPENCDPGNSRYMYYNTLTTFGLY